MMDRNNRMQYKSNTPVCLLFEKKNYIILLNTYVRMADVLTGNFDCIDNASHMFEVVSLEIVQRNNQITESIFAQSVLQ